MTEHLPECCVGPNGCNANPCQRCHACCICEQLRACEERVISEGDEQSQIAYKAGRNDLMQEQDKNENTYSHGYQAGHAVGTEEALARIDIWINLSFANHKPGWLAGLRRAVLGGYVEARMTEHLPECHLWLEPMLSEQDWCICDRLRTCEQRIRNQDIATHHADLKEAKALLASRDEAWFAGVDAARKAVAALRGCIGTDDRGDGTVWVEKIDALTAIDALKEEKK